MFLKKKKKKHFTQLISVKAVVYNPKILCVTSDHLAVSSSTCKFSVVREIVQKMSEVSKWHTKCTSYNVSRST